MSRPGHIQKLNSPGLRRRRRALLGEHWWVAIPVVLVVGALLVVLRADGSRAPSSSPVADAGLEHVHGLGVDPADGTLYAATHTGLFRIPREGQPERVADRYQDTMGFTVVGARHFVASGHPAIEDKRLRAPGKPPLLGLVESTDAGETWSAVSLLGEADFHVLVAAHDRIFAVDAQTGNFMVSSDKKTWETRSQLAIASLAVDPGNAENIFAYTETGVMESADGGRNWAAVDAPAITSLSWDGELGLWATGPGGGVFYASGEPRVWQKRGSLPGDVEAFLAGDDYLYAAVRNDAAVTEILRSTDGQTWELLYRGD